MSDFSKSNSGQSTQIVALEAAIDTAIANSAGYTHYNTSSPTQDSIETAWLSTLGKTGAIPPETKFYWWDGTQIRGTFGTLYDYFAPLFSQRGAMFNGNNPQTWKWVTWRNTTQLYINASWYTTTAGVFSDYSQLVRPFDQGLTTDGTMSTTGEVINKSRLSPYEFVFVNSSNQLRHNATGAGTFAPSIGATTPRAAALAVDVSGTGKWVFYRDSTNPNDVKRWTKSGNTTTTIVSGFSNLSYLEWDETTQKLLLFSYTAPNTTAVSKCNFDGSGLTSLVPSGNYAAGTLYTGYHWVGEFVMNGFLYVPVPGNAYVNRYRKYNISTGTYVEEDFDFGLAKPVMEQAVKDAKAFFEGTGGYQPTQQGLYYGTQFYAYPTTRLLNFERNINNDKWLLTYETGANSPLPGAQSGLAWAILPDNGSSGKIYPLSEFTNGLADCVLLGSVIYDNAVKEMNLSWTLPLGYRKIVIQFDNGLTAATENIRIQFGGDTGTNYDFSFYRNVVSTISNTTAAAQNYIELYGVNTTTVLGGKYVISAMEPASAVCGIQIEGSTALGVATNNVNSILGVGKWARGSTIFNSIRIFLSGSTATFPANAKVEVYAYRGGHDILLGGF